MVAQTILAQLGGNRFLAMTGAKVSSDGPALNVRLPRYRTIRITLTPADTYLVEEIRVNARTLAVTRKTLAEDAYAGDLRPIFEAATGLLTSL